MSITKTRDFVQLKSKIPTVTFLQKYLPDGKKTNNEWVCRNPTRDDKKAGSFKVNVNTGVWCDFATGDKGGDLIDLYAYLHRCDTAKAYDDLSAIFHHCKPLETHQKQKTKKPIIFATKEDFPEATGLWVYYDYDGAFLGYIIRLKRLTLQGKKIYMPIIEQDGQWMGTWWPVLEKPLYNAHLLKEFPNKPVLIVEGEKTADAATVLFPDFICITWMGGSGNADKADLTHLNFRNCILWPDNDVRGIEAMKIIEGRLQGFAGGIKRIHVETLGLPEKWDLADYGDDSVIDLETIKKQLIIKTEKITKLNTYDFPDLSEKGKALNTTDNIAYLINNFGIGIKYNLMTNNPEFYSENIDFNIINKSSCFFTEISNLCVKNNVPKVDLYDHINLIAEKNCYHPAIEFIQSKPWDGISRLNDLFNTITSPKQELSNNLIYRWLISCVAALYLPEGIASEGALVLQGKQKVGKTYWLLKLLPENFRHLIKEGVSVSVNNKDDLIKATNVWIAELGEIQSTFKKSDVDELKNFITRSYDEYREPFGRFPKKCWRRTIFAGSVNSYQFLADETGNRRFWTIPVTNINYNHSINMQQLWAEVKMLYDGGESYRLTPEEQNLLNESNKEHECVNPLKELILNNYYWESSNRRWMVPTNILIELDQLIDKGKTNNLANTLRELQIASRNSKRGTEYEIPHLKPPHLIHK